ncbi:MFS transporter [Chitiniphilus eburneus]|uniref:MFS transporter n=1 Tax=Chitiniphilus eburneus TaxID=2571148 RepID=A0A4U0QBJ1_9NEIS|nr:MFS transporter [Chitiniphilus eburneus]TJZ78727.1 MFS transporter [Chitiniphilus eburneus]
MKPAFARQNAWLLGLCQFCYMAATATGISFSGLVGARLAPWPALATVPYLLITASTALATLVVPRLIARLGYRKVFALGAVIGLLGGMTCVAALFAQSFALFCLAAPLQGFYQATSLYYRYAAAESAPDAHKGSAMAWVLSGGILAAFAGPLLGGYAVDRIPGVLYAGSFIGMALMALLALLPLALTRLPAPPPVVAAAERPRWRDVLAAPPAMGGILACAGGYALMMFMMVASPLAIAGCGFTPVHAASVIQWHMLGMFAPSLITGRLIARFGAPRIAVAGGLLNLVACVMALAGLTLNHFHLSLLLVGLGWNLMYMGGSTLIAQSPPAARARLQSANELFTFCLVALAAGLAGWVYQALGWYAVARIALGLTLGLGVAALWLTRRPWAGIARREAA